MSDMPTLSEYLQVVKEKKDLSLPIYSVTLRDGMQRRETLGRSVLSELESKDNLFAAKGDICYNMMRMWQGASGLAPEDCHVSPAYVVCRPRQNLDSTYASYLLRSEEAIKKFIDRSQGVTSDRWRLYPDEFLKISLFIPPLPEQKKIAEILSGIDQELDTCNACLSRTNLLRTSLLKSMIKDAEEHSIDQPLGSIVEVINGRAYKLSEWENEGTPVIRLQNLTKKGGEFYYSNLRLSEKQYCNKGDLLFMWSASFGPHIWWGEKAIYHYHIWKMVPRDDSILKNYLYLYLQHKTEEWKSQGSGMAMIHLTKERIEKEVIPLPSVMAQEKVVCTMESIDERIAAVKKKADKYSLLKNAMSSDLLSGRKRVSV